MRKVLSKEVSVAMDTYLLGSRVIWLWQYISSTLTIFVVLSLVKTRILKGMLFTLKYIVKLAPLTVHLQFTHLFVPGLQKYYINRYRMTDTDFQESIGITTVAQKKSTLSISIWKLLTNFSSAIKC